MDELSLGFTLALLGVLTGGFLTVLAQSIAARRLDERLKRALHAEIQQNAAALEPFAYGSTDLEPIPRMRRDGWASANALQWVPAKFLSVAALYHHLDRYDALAQMIVLREVQTGRHDLSLRMQAQAVGKQALELVDGAKRAAT